MTDSEYIVLRESFTQDKETNTDFELIDPKKLTLKEIFETLWAKAKELGRSIEVKIREITIEDIKGKTKEAMTEIGTKIEHFDAKESFASIKSKTEEIYVNVKESTKTTLEHSTATVKEKYERSKSTLIETYEKSKTKIVETYENSKESIKGRFSVPTEKPLEAEPVEKDIA